MTSTLIKAGRVFDGLTERSLEHAYIVVEGDAIATVGPQSDLNGRHERFAQEIDLGPDATILPGLINMHTHMSFSTGPNVFADYQAESDETKLIRSVENMQLALRTGVTTIRDCGTLNSIAFSMRDAIERGLLQGPRIVASGDGITTTGGHLWFCGIEADTEADVRRAVRAQVKAG
ncbi:MAG: amidohydrolase family protein, partial [Candidatus Tectomicrobia bacterium]|nr:amidohydrolase family protein [Candidatus Tectomicrobia bacterium]